MRPPIFVSVANRLVAVDPQPRVSVCLSFGTDTEAPLLRDGTREERLLDRAIEYLTKVTGKRPVGYPAPSWAFSAAMLDLIIKKASRGRRGVHAIQTRRMVRDL